MDKIKIEKKDIEYLDKFKDLKILVIGDVMLDRYLIGNSVRISPEAPVPVVKLEKEKYSVGGAGNVARNIETLGAKAYLFGTIGKDTAGNLILECLEDTNTTYKFVTSETLSTTTKARIITNGFQIARIDIEGDTDPDMTFQIQQREIISFLDKEVKEVDAVIISDYNKGILHGDITPTLKRIQKTGAMLFVDAKPNNLHKFRSTSAIIKPNKQEALEFCDSIGYKPKNIEDAAKMILDFLEAHTVMITEGRDGMTLADFLGHAIKIPGESIGSVNNVIGAGDVVLATFILTLAADVPLEKAAYISNLSGAISLLKPYTGWVSINELKRNLEMRI